MKEISTLFSYFDDVDDMEEALAQTNLVAHLNFTGALEQSFKPKVFLKRKKMLKNVRRR